MNAFDLHNLNIYNNMSDIELLKTINDLNLDRINKYKKNKLYINEYGFTYDKPDQIININIQNIRRFINNNNFLKPELTTERKLYYKNNNIKISYKPNEIKNIIHYLTEGEIIISLILMQFNYRHSCKFNNLNCIFHCYNNNEI